MTQIRSWTGTLLFSCWKKILFYIFCKSILLQDSLPGHQDWKYYGSVDAVALRIARSAKTDRLKVDQQHGRRPTLICKLEENPH
jgi:hypothetical protein